MSRAPARRVATRRSAGAVGRGALLFALASIASLSTASCRAAPAPGWSPASFPNPQTDPEACGRPSRGTVCDPDRVLSEASADRVQGTLIDILDGAPPYVKHDCGDDRHGYSVAVAVMRRMDPSVGDVVASSPGDAPPGPAARARAFAKALHDSWGVGDAQCGDGVLVLVSVDDHQAYVSTGKGSAEALSDEVAGAVLAAAVPDLKARRYDRALERIAVDVGLALAGQDDFPPDDDEVGWAWPLAIFGGIFAWAAVRSGRQSARRRRDERSCKLLMERIKREQAELRAGAIDGQTSCPICLCEFKKPGHDHDHDRDSETSRPNADPEADERSGLVGGGGRGARRAGVPGQRTLPSAPAIQPGPSGEPVPVPRSEAQKNAAKAALRRAAQSAAAGGGGAGGDGGAGSTDASDEGKEPVTLRCGHTFCDECITQWLERGTTCPICRRGLDEGQPDGSSGGGGSGGGGGGGPSGPGTGGPGGGRGAGPGSSLGSAPRSSDGAPTAYSKGSGASGPSAASGSSAGGSSAARPRASAAPPPPAAAVDPNLLLDFELRSLQRLYPTLITDAMIWGWTTGAVSSGRFEPVLERDRQLFDPEVTQRHEHMGHQGTDFGFGGGSSLGGGGAGASW